MVRLDGHVVDSLLLAKVLDVIVDAGARYRIVELDVGTTSVDPSHVRLEVTSVDEESLDALLAELQVHGVNRVDASDAELVIADRDGVLPEGFYSTTNLPTWVRVGGRWIPSGRPEMDCALVVGAVGGAGGAGAVGAVGARVVPMHRVLAGDPVVVGWKGVRVETPGRESDALGFGFMTSEVSSEKPKALSVTRVADSLRRARAERDSGGDPPRGRCSRCAVPPSCTPVRRPLSPGWSKKDGSTFFSPATVSPPTTSSRPCSARHSESLSVRARPQSTVMPITCGSSTRCGDSARLRRAVEAGWLTSGVLYECVRAGVPVRARWIRSRRRASP